MNVMQIRQIACEIVAIQRKRIGAAVEEATADEIDSIWSIVMDILARKEEILKELSAGR